MVIPKKSCSNMRERELLNFETSHFSPDTIQLILSPILANKQAMMELPSKKRIGPGYSLLTSEQD